MDHSIAGTNVGRDYIDCVALIIDLDSTSIGLDQIDDLTTNGLDRTSFDSACRNLCQDDMSKNDFLCSLGRQGLQGSSW